jgi:hypothetical protein
MTFDEIQSQWLSQPTPEVPIDSALLLQQVQTNQRKLQSTIFWRDVREVGVAFAMAAVILPVGLRRWDWELLLMGACVTFVGVFMLVDRWRQGRKRPVTESTLQACTESSLAELEHQIWLLRNVFWWYLLPCLIGATGIILPVVLRDWNTLPAARHIMAPIAAAVCIFCGGILWAAYRLNQMAVRDGLEPRRQELLSILARLQESES